MKDLIRAAKRPFSRALARRRFARALRPDDHFVVTYPKSGTNWVGFFLACAVTRHEPPETREAIDLVSYRQWVPDVNRGYRAVEELARRGLPSPRFMTTHSAYDRLFPRVINVIRDPRDVMVSYYHHYRRTSARFDQSLHEFVSANRMHTVDWGEHVRGWLSADPARTHTVRYEDLKADPLARFGEMVRFAGLDLTVEELDECVRRSSFDRMQKKERWDDEDRARPIAFVRKGKAGGWRDEMDDETVTLIESRYHDLMKDLGYEPAH